MYSLTFFQLYESKKYKCDECHIEFCNSGQLDRHKDIHDRIRAALKDCGIFLPKPDARRIEDEKQQFYTKKTRGG